MERPKQTKLEMEQLNRTIKFMKKELRRKNKNLPQKNHFEFIGYLEKQQEESNVDFGFYLEFAQEGKIVVDHAPVNRPREDMEFLKNGLLRMLFLL